MIISNVGACISLLLGCFAVFYPKKIERLVGLYSKDLEGLSEVRATYGGFFIGISLWALYSQSKDAFFTIGLGWMLAALVRLVTVLTGSYSIKNLGGVFFEAAIGTLCLWGAIP